MKSQSIWHLVAAASLMTAAATAAQAQAVYRIVGPDGKVTFSDKPPASADQGKVVSSGVGASGAASAGNLPFELRQVAGKFPVTLYTASNCAPCDTGRAMLTRRGIPFTERTVNTPEDSESLKKISGDTSLPFMTIGGQRLRGFSDAEWAQYLDAAGYPKASTLPSGYRNAAPSPLVAIQAPAAAAPKPVEKPEPAPAQEPPAVSPSNPAGIKF